MPTKKKVKSVLSNWNSLKKEVQKYVNEKKIKEMQTTVTKFVKNAGKDLNKTIDKDIHIVKKKFNDEKKQLENLIDKMIQTEIKKAKKFVADQKKEINRLQKKLENLIPAKKKTTKKTTKKKTTKKKVTKKKTTKKVAKK